MSEQHFNELSPAELERLAMLSEELGEAQQAIGKILRHGYDSRDPTSASHPGNRYDLAQECGDVIAEINRMTANGDLDGKTIAKRVIRRTDSALQYAHHQATP